VWISFIGTGPLFAADGSFVRDGVQLFYRTSGTGLPIVLLSGGPGFDADYMMAVADVIPGSYQRIIYEQRGTGRSRVASLTAETMTLRHAVDDLEALRVHLKQDRLTLIGHSWGGMLALAYASQYPNRVDRMIVVGSGGATLEHLAWFEDNITARLRPEDLEGVRYWGEASS
jgi:proline iminopeptidase